MRESDFTLIDQYLSGELPETERADFERRLRQEPELARYLRLMKEVGQAIRIDSEEFRKDLEAVTRKDDPSAYSIKTPTSGRRRFLAIAAGIAALVALGLLWLLWEPGTTSDRRLFADHFTTYPNNVTLRGNGTGAGTLTNAMILYDRRAFEEANAALQQIVKSAPSDTARFFLAMTQLALKEPAAAEKHLQTVAGIDTSIYRRQAYWYLALAAIAQHDRKQATAVLDSLIQEDAAGFYGRKAASLLEKIR